MKRYFIEEAKCGVTEGGMACGPVPGNVVAAVRFREGEKSQWISLMEIDGSFPAVYLSDQDMYDDLLRDDVEDEEFFEHLEEQRIEDFEGITFGEDYSDIFMSMEDDPENPAIPLIRYLIALVRCGWDEVEAITRMAGRYADEMDIPMSDAEEDYREEYDEDEDDE